MPWLQGGVLVIWHSATAPHIYGAVLLVVTVPSGFTSSMGPLRIKLAHKPGSSSARMCGSVLPAAALSRIEASSSKLLTFFLFRSSSGVSALTAPVAVSSPSHRWSEMPGLGCHGRTSVMKDTQK